jgi:hypothetical protein
MTNEMELVVGVDGVARCIYDEALDLREIGRLSITRASHVEPDAEGNWWADMGPVDGPVLGPYGTRSEALVAEMEWLTRCVTATSAHLSGFLRPQQSGAAIVSLVGKQGSRLIPRLHLDPVSSPEGDANSSRSEPGP